MGWFMRWWGPKARNSIEKEPEAESQGTQRWSLHRCSSTNMEWPQARKDSTFLSPRCHCVMEEKVTFQHNPQEERTALLAVTMERQIAHSHDCGYTAPTRG